MNVTTRALTLTLGLLAAPAMAETNWTATGPKGGTAAGTTSCSKASGITTCQGNSAYTTPNGKVFQRESTATGTRFGGERVITTTGPNGKVATSTRNWVRN
jgi:hypothetical protein